MKPSDNDLDTISHQQMKDINHHTTQSHINQTYTNTDINEIRQARLHIQTKPSSSDDDNTNTPIKYIHNKHNTSIPINPWQDMLSFPNTTPSETKSISKNSDDNSDYHYSNTILSNHDRDNNQNKTSTLWNRNSNTIVWTKQNLMNRISNKTTHKNINSSSQTTLSAVWSKESYDSHRKHHTSSNSSNQTEFMIKTNHNQLNHGVTNPDYHFSPIQYPRATPNGISRLLQIDSNKIDQQNHAQHERKNSEKADMELPSASLQTTVLPIKPPSTRHNDKKKIKQQSFR